jgi:hypothetical protein
MSQVLETKATPPLVSQLGLEFRACLWQHINSDTGDALPCARGDSLGAEKLLRISESKRIPSYGYAVDHEEFHERLQCLALPSSRRWRPVRAGFSVPKHRFEDTLTGI